MLPLRNAQIKQYTLLNDAFELATEWGENFAKPIHERMLKKHPELSVSDIDTLVKTAKDAESAIYRLCEEEEAGKIHEAEIFSTVSNQYIWLNPQHARRLIGIGMYYARR